MATDPYEVLGVKREATQQEVQKAYRNLAKKLHPDLNPGDKTAEQRFKEVSAAYDILGDPEKRARFDRGEIDSTGAEQPQRRYYRDFADADSKSYSYGTGAGFADFMEGSDIFSDFFSQHRAARMRGRDVRYHLQVDFLDAVNGASRQVTLPDGTRLDVHIPAGIRDGQILRLRGKGEAGLGKGAAGDALIEIEIRPHRFFRRDGDDIRLDLAISLSEAVLGTKLRVPTPTGDVVVTLPKWCNTGKVLRLKGRGVARPDGSRGNEYITLRIVLPEKPDPDLEAFVSTWSAGKAHNPRQSLEV